MTAVRDPFSELPHTPGEHFKLHFLRRRAAAARAARRHAAGRVPVPRRYHDELAGGGATGSGQWAADLTQWEESAGARLPLRRLGCDPYELALFFTAGLADEDARFGAVWEAMLGVPGAYRPTLGLLTGLVGGAGAPTRDPGGAPAAPRRRPARDRQSDAPRGEWALQPPPLVWDAARGELDGAVGDWAATDHPRRSPTRTT